MGKVKISDKELSDIMDYALSFDFCTAEEKRRIYAACVDATLWGKEH